jgi:hypothetical protein
MGGYASRAIDGILGPRHAAVNKGFFLKASLSTVDYGAGPTFLSPCMHPGIVLTRETFVPQMNILHRDLRKGHGLHRYARGNPYDWLSMVIFSFATVCCAVYHAFMDGASVSMILINFAHISVQATHPSSNFRLVSTRCSMQQTSSQQSMRPKSRRACSSIEALLTQPSCARPVQLNLC